MRWSIRSLPRSVSHGGFGMNRNVRNVESKATIGPLAVPEFDYVSQGVLRVHQVVVGDSTQPADDIEQAGVVQFLEVTDVKPAQFPFPFAVPIPLSATMHTNRSSEYI